jgi:DNA phosphorothioation-dependent restriction protein DptH
MSTGVSTYYREIIDLLIDNHRTEFNDASKGHCMKITGFGQVELDYLLNKVRSECSNLQSFIVSDEIASPLHISASKLIELRNNEERPILILIPANTRTAAEDSYGNNTFKDLSLDTLESKLRKKLIKQVPPETRLYIEHVLKTFEKKANALSASINYLLAIKEDAFTVPSIGNHLYFFGLIPDGKLFESETQSAARLNFNTTCSTLLSTFNKPIYDRISEMPLRPDSIQQSLVEFLKAEIETKNAQQLFRKVFDVYNNLNFANWPIPELDKDAIKVLTQSMSSSDFVQEDGLRVLRANDKRSSKVKIKYSTQPTPKDIGNLRTFRITLMRVDGGSGEEVAILKRIKNTSSARNYREATIELHPNVVEEGSYFFRVFAEDEHNNVLNLNDDFKEANIQREWEKAKTVDESYPKSSFNFKLTCDSDDFHFVIEEGELPSEDIRKEKVHSVTEAYLKYCIEDLRKGQISEEPIATAESNVWQDGAKQKLISTFYIAYNTRHNYQINIPTKLREIETVFLKNHTLLGSINGLLSSNAGEINFKNLQFRPSVINEIVDTELIAKRDELFNDFLQSNESGNGIVETTNLVLLRDKIADYIKVWSEWVSNLRSKVDSKDITTEERERLQMFLAELQFCDIVKIKSKLPDGTQIDSLLLAPTHPLRLSWFVLLIDLFKNWSDKTKSYAGHQQEWLNNLEGLFEGDLYPENNPTVLVEPNGFRNYHYSGELMFGWGIYLAPTIENSSSGSMSIDRQATQYFRQLLNVGRENFVDNDVNLKLVVRQIKNYLIQHPYTDKLVLNLFNAGDAFIFADAFVQLETDLQYQNINYEIRIFKGSDRIIEHGEGLKNLLNPESNVREEAETFAQSSLNRLFPKLRFSINLIEDYLRQPSLFTAHISFLVSPFPVRVELYKPIPHPKCFYLNGLIADPALDTIINKEETKWNKYLVASTGEKDPKSVASHSAILFNTLQTFTAGTLASKATDSIPSTQVTLNAVDKVLLAHLHNHSDWVITYDRNLGPEIFDLPSRGNSIPFLLDYLPGDEVSGISSFLTTRPTSEILALLGPHFSEFGLDVNNDTDTIRVHNLLEDLRALSSSLILQLNSTRNKAFEVIGAAFTKRVLEKKGFLEESFLIPIDLHQDLFEDLDSETKSRADNLLVTIDPERRQIGITVIEVKCRKSLSDSERQDLKTKMRDQIANTIEAIRTHFDPSHYLSYDRLDRELKNKELKSLLSFYLRRAARYEYISDKAFRAFDDFLQTLDNGFSFDFRQMGLIFDLGFPKRYVRELIDGQFAVFTFGGKVIKDILDPESDLNTRRLEEKDLDGELSDAIGVNQALKEFVKQFKVDQAKPWTNEKAPETLSRLEDNLGSKEILDKSDFKDKPDENDDDGGVEKDDGQTSDVVPPTGAGKINQPPKYDVLVGKNEDSEQYGILGKTITGKTVAIDLGDTNTISLFGVQGGGKSYTIGTIAEMVLKQFGNINKLVSPLAGVIFHYSESMDYEPEFTSMIQVNDKATELSKLKNEYGASPDRIEDVILLTPKDKVDRRRADFPSIKVLPISFNSKELNVQDWLFLLGAVGNDSAYIKQLKSIMKGQRNNLSIEKIATSVEDSLLLSNNQKVLAGQKLSFAKEYVDDGSYLKDLLRPGRLIIVDLRDEFIVKDEALGLFVIMLNIFSGVKNWNGNHFNKFIVFDEAHKYMDNKDLTGNIVTAIREMRHKGVSIMIASQDPPSLPNEIIELSSIVLLHKFNSPQWLKHIQKSITQLSPLTPADMSSLNPGEGFVWASKASDKSICVKPTKISTRPRVTKHGGSTIQATGKS